MADLRAAVLEEIDDLLSYCDEDDDQDLWQAMHLLREDSAKHEFCPGCEMVRGPHCNYCGEDWPCPTLISRARVYAPEALAEMEEKK